MILLGFVVVAVALRFPETPGGKLLKQILTDVPGQLVAKITFGRIFVLLFVAVLVAGLFALAKSDGLMLMGPAGPEAFAWLATFDVATWAETVALVMLIGAAGRLRGALRAVKRIGHVMAIRTVRAITHLAGRVSRAGDARARRRRKAGARRPPADDGDWAAATPVWAVA